MDKFRDKIFNAQVFETYRRTLESTKENSLIKNALFNVVNKYKSKMSSIKEKIQDIEEQCNNYILSMYKMTDDDIHIILR